MDQLDHDIREYDPGDGDWRSLDSLITRAFESPDPRKYYDAIFNLFERFPSEDGAGVFWSALHGMESVGDYEDALLRYFRRHPNLMTTTMLRRIRKTGQSHIGQIEISKLIPS